MPDTDYQRLQHFLAHSAWDHAPVMRQVAQEADRLLGGQPDTCLLIEIPRRLSLDLRAMHDPPRVESNGSHLCIVGHS